MGYIDKAFYRDTYKGTPIANDNELDVLIMRASSLIDELTMYKIPMAGGLEKYFAMWHEEPRSMMIFAVKNAVACQVEYLYMNGGAVTANEGIGGNNVRIGNFSYTDNNAGSSNKQYGAYGSDSRFSKLVYGYLNHTDLLFRGIGTCT